MDDNLTASLDTLETTGQLTMPRSYRDWSVDNAVEEVAATREVYSFLAEDNDTRKVNAFDTCRSRSWFVRHSETGDVRVASKSCKLRWCPLCAKKRQWFLVEQLRPWAESVPRLKFFTLTLKHSNAPLHDQIDNLYKFFQRYRKLKYLRENIHGGIWFFQIKKSKKTGQWHPHLHCLLDAEFMSQEKLSGLWCKTTNGSTIVDIRAADDTDKVAEYVGRYSARPSSLGDLSFEDRLEVVQALHGRRLLGLWGTARSVKLKMEKPEDANKWHYIGSWSTVWGTLATDSSAKAIYKAWRKGEPLEAGVDMRHIENCMDDTRFHELIEPPEDNQMYMKFRGVL